MIDDFKRSYPFNRLTPYIIEGFGINADTEYEIIRLPARSLICERRIDLMAKWLLLDAMEGNGNLDECIGIYRRHIEVWSGGTFTECGSPEKNSFDKYLSSFLKLRDDIKCHGFNEDISMLPVGSHCEILDGAHRLSCAAYYGYAVTAIRFPSLSVLYDAEYFKALGLDEKIIKILIEKYNKLTGIDCL